MKNERKRDFLERSGDRIVSGVMWYGVLAPILLGLSLLAGFILANITLVYIFAEFGYQGVGASLLAAVLATLLNFFTTLPYMAAELFFRLPPAI